MTEAETPAPDRHWWLKMIAASTALVALAVVLLALAFLVKPHIQLHYHAWRYRTGRDVDGSSLAVAGKKLAAEHASVEETVKLLGPPSMVTACGLWYGSCPLPVELTTIELRYPGGASVRPIYFLCESGHITSALDADGLRGMAETLKGAGKP